MSDIEARVKEIVVEQLGVNAEEVTADASFIDDLGADSLDTVELVMALEEAFECEIPDEDAAVIVVATEPTELISTDGDPSFSPISETDLLYVENSENDIFLNIDSQEYFILISGRWYKSTSLDKHKAIATILHIKNPLEFTINSGYLDDYME